MATHEDSTQPPDALTGKARGHKLDDERSASVATQSSFSVTFLKVFPARRVTSAVACPFYSSGTMLTARAPAFAFTAASAAASKGTVAFSTAVFCSIASFKSMASLISSTLVMAPATRPSP